MSFLRVSGMAIPVKAESAEERRKKGGEYSRAMSGSVHVNQLYDKRTIRGMTTQMSLWEAERIRKIIEGEGHLWPFTADTYSSRGLAATTDDFSGATELSFTREKAEDSNAYETRWQPQNISPVKWAGVGRALWAPWRQASDESINNLLDAADRRCSSAAGFHAIGTPTVTLDSDNYVDSSFPNSIKVVTDGSGEGVYVDINPAVADYYAASAYILATVGSVIVTARDETNTTDLGTDTISVDADKWQRVSLSSLLSGSSSDLRLKFEDDAMNPATFYIALPQIERNRAPNMWNDGDGDNTLTLETGLSYIQALGSTKSFSIRGWCYPLNDFGSENNLFTSTLTSNQRNVFYLGDATNYIEMYVVGSSWTVASSGIASPLTFAASPDNWLHFTVAVDRDAGNMTVQIAGAASVSDTEAITSLDFSSVTNGLTIGDDIAQDNTKGLCGIIQDLALVPYAIATSQHDNLFDAGAAFAPLSQVHVDGDIIEDAAFTARFRGRAEVSKIMYGEGESNQREVSFELMEM